jgi:AcrR family transcriptional regulator
VRGGGDAVPGLRERKRLATWRAIRAAALRLFAQRGYDAVSGDEIADRAGVSRSTFFNYFGSKEAVVFDQDPEEQGTWRTLMTSRPDDEPVWDAVSAVLVGFSHRLGDRMPLLRRLKATSPALAQYSHDLSEQFAADLRAWATDRVPPGDRATALLCVNVALAAMGTAYEVWRPDESYERYLEVLGDCLDRAGAGLGGG